jgi:Sigma-70, region 4
MAVLLDQLIATLPGKLRDPMLLSLNQELTQAEIGRVLSIPESSVRTRRAVCGSKKQGDEGEIESRDAKCHIHISYAICHISYGI